MKKERFLHLVDKRYLSAWILITLCFALWGFANNVTSSLANDFSKIFRISNTEASMVQVAYYLGYFSLAFPAAMFIQKFSYKWGIVAGLALFAAGSLFFIPARWIGDFYPFLTAYFVLTCGLSFLETACNPYIYSLGDKNHAIERLNGAQAFNALGAVLGMLVAMHVQSLLAPLDTELRHRLPEQQFDIIKYHDLNIFIQPYILMVITGTILLLLVIIGKTPKDTDIHTPHGTLTILKNLLHIKSYREGVLTEFFYVGAQVSCWTLMIPYAMRVFMAEGMPEQYAEVLSQKYNTVAIVLFAIGRFVFTPLLRRFSPSRILSTLGILAVIFVLGAILFTDRNGIYCLMIVSACMSIMFATIYGIALMDVGANIKIGGAGLTMASLGGSFFPLIQAAIIHKGLSFWGLPATNLSFIITLSCMVVVIWYGHRSYVRYHIKNDADDIPSIITVPE